MITYIKHNWYVAIAVVLLLAVAAPFALANHAWGNYHWARTANPFALQVVNSMDASWQDSLTGAIADWNKSAVLSLELNPNGSTRRCRGVDGMVEACNDTYGNTNWLGIAQIWVSGDHIVKGTVKMNDTYFNTPDYADVAWRNLVVCQEIGHTFGLGHQDELFNNANLDTCMDYTSNPSSNQHPNNHDYEMLAQMYSHTDGFNSYAAPSTGGGDTGGGGKGRGKPNFVGQNIDLENPSAWGEVVKADAHGNPSLYKRNLGNGQSVYTHVTWILGAEDTHSH